MKQVCSSVAVAFALLLSGCGNGDSTAVSRNEQDAESWQSWHADKQRVDQIVLQAINEPDGGDYAKAADAIRSSNRPAAIKQFQLGQLIVGGLMENSKRRPPETLEQGLRMMEDSALAPGQKPLSVAQQLRFLFERGDGAPPNNFPVDAQIAACWLEIEEHRSSDPARCISLRRQRLPDLDRPAVVEN